MKTFLFSIGFLTVLLPAVVAAQCPESEAAQKLLSEDPIGHYTIEVFDRVDTGISNAKDSPSGEDIVDLMDMHFLITIESIMYMLVDTDLRAVEYSRDLATITSCLHLDLAMMEAKMEEIRCEINAAYEAKSSGAIRQLKGISSFLNERYRHLVRGALEPDYTDEDWVFYNEFDDPFEGWCCVLDLLECQVMESDDCTVVQGDGTGGYDFYDTKDACTVDSTCVFAEDGDTDPKYKPICPFDSDYLADNSTGYGCQLTLLGRFSGGDFEAITAEADALIELTEIRDSFLEDISHIKDTTLEIDNLVDETMLNEHERRQLERFGEVEDVDHKRIFGCDADVPDEESEDDEDGTDLNPGVKPSEEWSAIARRGPFFFHIDHLTIWKKYFRLQHEWAAQREYPEYLRLPDEFPDEDDRIDAAELEEESLGLMRGPRLEFRNVWMNFMHKQATREASILPKAQDAELEVLEALAPLRPAIKRLIGLVTEPDVGIRKFARNYAYFLRRSCLYRPCNEKLETIMKVLYSNECFPYASGEFTGGLEPNPEHVTCMEDVGDSSYCNALYDKYLGDPHWKKCQEAVDDKE
jgi:hypothetical protein